MLPSSPFPDVHDRCLRNSESFGGESSGVTLTPIGMKLLNDVISELGAGVIFPFKRIGRKFTLRIKLLHGLGIGAVPTLRDGIPIIVQLGAKKQMVRSYAGRIIALVQYVFSIGDRAEVKKPRSPICLHMAHASPSRSKHSIPPSLASPAGKQLRTSPNPTLSKFRNMRRDRSVLIDLGPKAFWKADGKTLRQRGMLYKRYHDEFSCPSALLAQRAF